MIDRDAVQGAHLGAWPPENPYVINNLDCMLWTFISRHQSVIIRIIIVIRIIISITVRVMFMIILMLVPYVRAPNLFLLLPIRS